MLRLLRRFCPENRGNVAILFALAVVPVLGAMGAAVDYSFANAERTKMQKALDATALALSKIMPANQTTLNTVGNQYFQANFGSSPLKNVQLTITPGTGTLFVTAQGIYEPELVSIVGVNSFPVTARAEVKWSTGQVEVALVLDNTGSMSGQKIAKLKEGAQKLVDILKNAAKKAGDAKVAIVPYTVQVRVDPVAFASASWLKTGYCDRSQYKTQSNCTNNGGTWITVSSGSWTGCIADRDQKNSSNNWINHDVNDVAPTSNNDTKFPRAPWNQNDCPQALILPLTDVFTGYNTISNRISQMQAIGNTNVTIGAVWGWHMLDDKTPFTEGRPYNTKDLQKYLILMTDGENTESRYSTNRSTIDARTRAVCDNIKALPQNTANSPATPAIKVWTIRVIDGNASLLRDCATEPSMYFDVDDPNELDGVFAAIGTSIANLHLSK